MTNGALRSEVRKLWLIYDRVGGKYRIEFRTIVERSYSDGNSEDWTSIGDEVEEVTP